jgi:acetyl esterase/lipase
MTRSQLTNAMLYLLAFAICSTTLRAQTNAVEITEYNNIQYYNTPSPDSSLTQLNLIVPNGVDHPPVLIWIGQGAWAYVNKDVEMNICRQIAKQGIAVVSAQHRLSPALLTEKKRPEGVKHPQHVIDISHAFAWVYHHADAYGYDNENIFVGGFSSGAHLSALLAMDNRYLKNRGLSNKLIKAIIPVGGGYDIPDYKEQLVAEDPNYEQNHINVVFGETHAEHIDASPITYMDSLVTPVLLISEGDTYTYNRAFEALLVEKEIPNIEVLNLHNYTHAGLWRELGGDAPSLCRDYMIGYIKRWSNVNDR